jgi:hypothetical protein
MLPCWRSPLASTSWAFATSSRAPKPQGVQLSTAGTAQRPGRYAAGACAAVLSGPAMAALDATALEPLRTSMVRGLEEKCPAPVRARMSAEGLESAECHAYMAWPTRRILNVASSPPRERGDRHLTPTPSGASVTYQLVGISNDLVWRNTCEHCCVR